MSTEKERDELEGLALAGRESMSLIDEHEEEVSIDGRKVRKKGVYFLPNLITTAALFSGFYAIVSAFHGRFEAAAVAMFVAMVFDGLDGRVARLTNTQSKFGAEYDSLSDMVSFGVTPALVMFIWGVGALGKFGWTVTFIYMACAALRLARFNTQLESADSNFFTGLASPAAASLIASFIWVCHDQGWYGNEVPLVMAFIGGLLTALAGLLMVINVRYRSFKELDFGARVPFIMMLVTILVFGFVSLDPPIVFLGFAIAYAVSGPIGACKRRLSDESEKA